MENEYYDENIWTKEQFSEYKNKRRVFYLEEVNKFINDDKNNISNKDKIKLLGYKKYLEELPNDEKWPMVKIKKLIL